MVKVGKVSYCIIVVARITSGNRVVKIIQITLPALAGWS